MQIRLFIMALLLLLQTQVMAARLQDIATLSGVRTNILTGYGLVVGLDGTGDRNDASNELLKNLLNYYGMPLDAVESRNVAAVLVTAEIPTFYKPGQRIDVVVSSLGDARSLRGGTLSPTALQGIDEQVYALAQGSLITGIGEKGDDGSRVTVGVKTSGSVPKGAVIEREISAEIATDGFLYFNLAKPSFGTVNEVVNKINSQLGGQFATGTDNTTIKVQAPRSASQMPYYIALLEDIEVVPTRDKAKVVVNSRTGSVVINGQVRLYPAVVSYGQIVLSVDNFTQVSQPNAFAEGETRTVVNSEVNISRGNNQSFMIPATSNLTDVFNVINQAGLKPDEIVGILEALDKAGAIEAELIVL